MRKYKIDDDTIWEDTGKIVIHNFPPDSPRTISWASRIYREIKRGKYGWKEVEGPSIPFHQMPNAERALAIIIGNAQNALSVSLPPDFDDKYLIND